jgi:3-hydroxyacyl-CoA dehydrogenase
MKWGFGWDLGPFEIWDGLGLEKSVEKMKQEGKTIPTFVSEMLANGKKSFYEKREGVQYLL